MFKELPIAKCCDFISKVSIYVLVFLLPIFFLPWTSDVLDFNKQILLIGLVFLAFFSWIIKSLVSGIFSVNLSKIHIAVLILFLTHLLSTIFSLDKYGSFWGWPRPTADSLLTTIGLVLFYFLVSNIFSKKEILKSIIILILSGLVAILVGVSHMLGLFVLPFTFTKIASFNTIGLVSSLGLLIAVLLPVLMVLEIFARKWLKIIFALGIILSVIALILINYSLVWWMVLISSILTILFGMLKKELFDLRWLGLPIFFLAVAVFFLVLKPQFNAAPRPIEVFLNQPATLDIVLQTLKQKAIFLGSGPGTFVYDFLKYKKVDFNAGPLWNMQFGGGGSKILTMLATIGILGFISFLILMALVVFYGLKFIFKPAPETNNNHFPILALGVLIGLITQTIGYFLYSSNLSLDFVYFFLIACFIGLAFEKRKDYLLGPSSFLTVGITFILILSSISGLWLLILEGQRYAAEINYLKGITAFASGNKDEAINNLGKAVKINPYLDLYFMQLSQAYISKLGDEINRQDLPQDVKNKNIEILISNSINAAKIATDINPYSVADWSARGLVYQTLIGLLDGAGDWAIKSYDEAIKLDPNSPYYPTQAGLVYLAEIQTLPNQTIADQNKILASAKDRFAKAVLLKPDYAPALYQMARIYQMEGKTDEALAALENTQKYAPDDLGLAFQLGVLYYQKGDFAKAQAELEQAIALSPDYANALYFLGLTYDELGQKDKAIEEFLKVAELNPDNSMVKKILDNLKAGKNALEDIGQEESAEALIK
jgi:tetratricopeptide (TPR) repeat protein